MDMLKKCFAGLFCIWSLTGCGTLVRGTTETFQITSEPVGALAVFSSGEVCTTPCAVEKKRDEPFSVRITKEGYQPFSIQIEEKASKSRNLTMLGNLLMFGSVLWASIDTMNGANRELTPNPSRITLVRADTEPESYPSLVSLAALDIQP